MKPKILIITAITIILFSCHTNLKTAKNEPVLPEKLDTIEYACKAFGHGEKLLLLSIYQCFYFLNFKKRTFYIFF